jgi:UDP-N-acetylglucosamine--N-acetylmuramyl-(pentapeptide) pyrophosphoryl-undecaprenol N-acetylglucosamine transferase
LNDWVVKNREKITGAGIHILCVTGPGKTAPTAPETDGTDASPRVRFIPFCDKMPEALSAADVVVSRSGAGSIAEFITCSVPSVLVPYPFAADNHQEANARFLESLGGGAVVPQTQIETLTGEVLRLLGDDAALAQLRENLRLARARFAWQPMVEDIIQLADARGPAKVKNEK